MNDGAWYLRLDGIWDLRIEDSDSGDEITASMTLGVTSTALAARLVLSDKVFVLDGPAGPACTFTLSGVLPARVILSARLHGDNHLTGAIEVIDRRPPAVSLVAQIAAPARILREPRARQILPFLNDGARATRPPPPPLPRRPRLTRHGGHATRPPWGSRVLSTGVFRGTLREAIS